ncbi:hypothetical protein ACI65C_003989 [Semiaphis heraclei]
MSESERKKRSQCIDVWEEAGSEFYQESYPGMEADLEAFQKNPNKLSTLLPSNKTRTARKKINNGTVCYQATATLKPVEYGTLCQNTMGCNNEIQISLMPDLSENLSNEELVWEEIMKIKTMPISMAHKKELKAKLKSADAFRLQGFQQLRWQKRKICNYFKTEWLEFYNKFHLWNSSLKKIEGHCGAGVVEFFLFIKLLIFLNALTMVVVFIVLILPSVYWVELKEGIAPDLWNECGSSNESASIECCSAIYENTTRVARPRVTIHYVMDIIQGTGWVESTPMYYSYYPNQHFSIGKLFTYHIPLAYIVSTISYFLLFFLIIVRKSIKGFKQRMVETQVQYYLYSNSIFIGWDFCINNKISAILKQKAIFNELRSFLIADRPKFENRNRSKQINIIIIRLLISFLVIALIGSACFSVYLIFYYSIKLLQREQTFMWAFLFEFATPVAITFYNIVLPIIFDVFLKFENRSMYQETRLCILRIICVRLSLLVSLLGSIYKLINCVREKSQCASALCNSPLCWETYVGKIMYKLLIVEVASKIGITVLISCPRSILVRHFKHNLFQVMSNQELNLAKHVLDVIYIQIIVWLGSFYVTLLPALGLVSMVIMFYIKRFSCIVNYSLAQKVYSPSRAHTMIMSMLLISYILCVTTWLTVVSKITPSRSCGPFKGLPSIWRVLIDFMRTIPPWTITCYEILFSANFVAPLIFILSCIVYYYNTVMGSNKKMIMVLRKQLVLEGHDKQFLLNRLSAFIKQQDRRRKATENNGEIDVLLS